MSNWESHLQEQNETYLIELLDFVRIPSISALPDHAEAVQDAAQWVADRLTAAGIEKVQVLPTGGHPVVYGEWLHAPDKPTILIYGHFDTQPADPLDLWDTPPFDPVVKDGRIYGRGASDDKGNMLASIQAVEALLKTEGSLPLNLKFCYEGQEEIGSPQLNDFVAAHKDLLACDMVFSSDGLQWSHTEPAIWLGLRGICGLQIDIKGATTDLHSGTFGGTIQNPLHALTRIVGSLRSPDGQIMVEGFYDNVPELSVEERAEIARVPYDEAEFLGNIGVSEVFGEPGYSTREREWIRPTLEINGIWGGFQGPGIKTVLPNEAHAKITCRLVGSQDPQRIISLIKEHVEQQAPEGAEVTVTGFGAHGKPYVMPSDHPGNEVAREVLRELYGCEPYNIRSGGSIPVCGIFLDYLGAYTVNFAFGLPDEPIHAPNEFFYVSSFERARQAYCMLLKRLGE